MKTCRFAYAYALEKSIKLIPAEPEEIVDMNVYEEVEDYCGRLGELRWLREERSEMEVERINERIRFRYVIWGHGIDNMNA